ncbi:IclR family transcriptional regulator [Allonocardiopsis opalescens]|uniref:Glycerol operon regulatory protein n=1 Tax=Allonocardiopsis opalescens TaxID=1144618 RepID=A0A2T0Q7F5_9ACTN|nr:helix-turn-helix domain-containing protein [Allonocardiopsis opalescens]PRX99748.1 IclR family transcriptional regulator [Allonocardiopsis opalescens]
MTTARSQDTPTAMIDRVASLLEVFAGHHRLTLAQISRRARLPRSSAHRILQRLVELGWVERQGFQYTIGIRMFELGSQAVRRDRVHQAALPVMHAVHRSTGLTAHLSVLVSSDVLHLERIGGWPDKDKGWRLGARQPAVHAAAGRALLARLDAAERPALEFPPPATPYGIRTPAHLDRELQRIRDRSGVAIDVQSCTAGITAVAAPIGPSESGLRAALSLCGPTDTMPTDKAVAVVRTAAMDIWYAASGLTRPRGRPHRAPARGGAAPAVAGG